MNQLARALLLSCVIAACGGSREGFPGLEVETAKPEVGEAEVVAVGEGEPEVTDAAGRAYLAKLTATGDTACACKTEECGKSVIESWALSAMTSGSYTLSTADRAREEKLLQRVLACGSLSAPDKRADIARLKAESKAGRTKVLALLDDSYEGESDAARTGFRAMRKALRALCACTTMACIEGTPLADPPVVTSKREVKLLHDLLEGVMSCGSYAVANELAVVD